MSWQRIVFDVKEALRYLMFATLITTLTAVICPDSYGQSNSNSDATLATSPSPRPEPTAIPSSAIVGQAEAVASRLRTMRASLTDRTEVSEIDESLSQAAEDIEASEAQDLNILAVNPSLETIRTIERRWSATEGRLAEWQTVLRDRAAALDKTISELNHLLETWRLTLSSLGPASESQVVDSATAGETRPQPGVPPELVQRVHQTMAAIEESRGLLQERLSDLLAKESRVSQLRAVAVAVREEVRSSRSRSLTNLVMRDAPPIWVARENITSVNQLIDEGIASFSAQTVDLRDYTDNRAERFILHGILFFLIAGGLYWARSRVKPFVVKEPKLEKAAQIFSLPIATSLILTILLSGWLYPEAPRLLSSLIGAAALVPVVFLLRRMVERPLFKILNALVVLYFVDRFRDVLANQPFTARVLFLAEMLGAILFLLWFLKSKRLSDGVEAAHYRIFEIIRKVIPFVVAVLIFALAANALGFVSLGHLIGNGLLNSAYVALIIYTAVQIIRGLIIFALRVPPLSRTLIVKNNRPIIRERSVRIVRWAAVILWVLITLNLFSVRQPVFAFLGDLFSWSATVGTVTFSFGAVVLFVVMIWIAVLISRFLRFVLEEDVYPRVGFGGGVSYAVSTMVHYSILVLGFLVAVGVLGVDFTKFALIAGAVGVGIGFGLQNIINNFVSGLILLVERPVKVDDTVQIGEHTGSLRQIGLRASVLRKVDGSDVIVPNSQLISEEVVNWTMSDEKRRIDIPVGVAYGTDSRLIFDLLTPIAAKYPEILQDPPPKTIFQGFGESSIDFELRVWTSQTDGWVGLRSDLITDVYDVLNNAGIEIPFPQRDVNLKTIESKADAPVPKAPPKKPKSRP